MKAVAAITIGVNNSALSRIAAGNVFIVGGKMDLCSVCEREREMDWLQPPLYHKCHVLSESQCVKVSFIIAWVDEAC